MPKLAKRIPSFEMFIFKLENNVEEFPVNAKEAAEPGERELWQWGAEWATTELALAKKVYGDYLQWAKMNGFYY